jgi:AmmeMemoRadiSam system protein A
LSDHPLNDRDGAVLIETARHAIERELAAREGGATPGSDPGPTAALLEPRGVFVTLQTVDPGRPSSPPTLRGCIGTLRAEDPVHVAVARYARHAAFDDPRFPPLRASEWPRVRLSVSVLTPPRPIASPEEIVPGRHGVILEHEGRSAVFLPQVAAEQGWDRTILLQHLARKAGLPKDAWRGARLSVFEAESFGERAAPD